MTADVELLPLPSVLLNWPHPTNHAAIRDYARACVAHATAARDAEIEALRAERDLFRDETIELVRQNGEWQARAEQLAEALSHQRWCRTCAEDGWESCEDGRKAGALLHPTAAQENDDA